MVDQIAKNLHYTTDPRQWAETFFDRFVGDTISDDQLSVEILTTWFAHAIDTGRLEGHTLGMAEASALLG